ERVLTCEYQTCSNINISRTHPWMHIHRLWWPKFDEHLYFFFNDTATTEIYTLSLHDALPISLLIEGDREAAHDVHLDDGERAEEDRKSTRLNSSHLGISYAVFCLKKKIIICTNRAAICDLAHHLRHCSSSAFRARSHRARYSN